jgi:hypothetical protein
MDSSAIQWQRGFRMKFYDCMLQHHFVCSLFKSFFIVWKKTFRLRLNETFSSASTKAFVIVATAFWVTISIIFGAP